MKAKKYILGALFMAALMTGCSDNWDNHYNSGEGVVNNSSIMIVDKSLTEYLSETPSLQSTYQLFEQTGMIDALLAKEQLYTILAVDGESSAASLDSKADGNVSSDDLYKAQTYISDVSLSPSNMTDGQRILMWNGKYLNITKTEDEAGETVIQFNNAKVTKIIKLNNGYLYLVDQEVSSPRSMYEIIENLGDDYSMFRDMILSRNELTFDKEASEIIGVDNTGNTVYDSVFTVRNPYFEAKGFEGQLNWSDKIGNVSYHIGGTFSYNTNKLVDIGGVTVLSSGFKDKQQNYPLNSMFGLRYIGKIQTEQQRMQYLYRYLAGNTIGLTNDIRLGDNMYEDVNKDGKLDYNDLVYLGTNDPKISFSFNGGLEWNNFDLSVVFQVVAQRTIFRTGSNNGNDIWRIPMKAVYLNTSNQSVGNTWSLENPNAHYPTYSNNGTINDYNYQCSSWSVENGTYIRLKNVTLGYNFPQELLAKTKAISSLRLYVTGADLWEFSKINDGWDPEASKDVSETGRFPFVRTVTFGLNVTF